MDLSIYEVIKKPWITNKAYQLNQDMKQLVLEVHIKANKIMIAQALKKLFNVETDTIRTVIIKGKKRRSRRRVFESKNRKKAIITLKKGQSVGVAELNTSPLEAKAL